MTEKRLQAEILKIIGSHPDFRLFRNNTGNITMLDGRRIQFGLCVGSADLIGLQKIKITEDMVGQEIARFISIEVKSEKGKLKPEQENWLEFINSFGGMAVVVSELDEIKKICNIMDKNSYKKKE